MPINAKGSQEKTVKSSVKKLYEIFSPRERMHILLLFLFSWFAAFAQAFGVVAFFPFISVLMNPEMIFENRFLEALYTWRNFNDTNSFTIFLGIGVFFIVVFSNIAAALNIWAKNHFVLLKNHTLSRRLLSVYLSKPYDYFLQKNTNELGTNILSEVGQLTSGYLMSLFGILIHGSVLAVMLIMLLIVDPIVTIGTIVFLGGSYGLLNIIIKKKLKSSGEARLQANSNRFRLASEALSSIKITKVMGNEAYFVDNYSVHSEKFARHNIFARVAAETPRYILEAIAFGGIVFFIVINLMRGEAINQLIPIVSLFAFAGYRMLPALNNLYNDVVHLYYNQAVLDKIYIDMIEEESENDSVLPVEALPRGPSEIEKLAFNERFTLKDIQFRYSNSTPNVIDNLTLSIEKNTSIGIAGATGAGKTTLVDIILGLLVPSVGEIMIDNTKITEINRRASQQMIGYVPQDIYLSDDTIRNNIAFGVPEKEIDEQKVHLAAKTAALDDFIKRELPQKYDTQIGERGVRLSGGQKQRIGLARALYRNPELLVLDEATSSLDGSTEEAVLRAIQNASKARTVIMIAHRLNTLKDCDQIYVIENGKILSQGTYDELLHHDETFMRMAKV